MDGSPIRNGSCHCGSIGFTVKLLEGLDKPRRCNCSFCRMRGAVVVTALVGDIAFTRGEDLLRLYQFNTMKAEHHFCPTCGIYTHHRRRSNPSHYSVNVACLEGVSPFDFESVPVYDGITHHDDRPGGAAYKIAGHLRYSAAVATHHPVQTVP